MIDAELQAQFREMGVEVPAEALAPEGAAESDAFEVMPSNWASLRAFLACETQWRSAGSMVGLIWLGLDYGAVDVVMRRLDLPAASFADLQVMERTALDVLGEASE